MNSSNVINLEDKIVQRFQARTCQIASFLHQAFAYMLIQPGDFYSFGIDLIACAVHFLRYAIEKLPEDKRQDAITFAVDFLEKAKTGVEVK